MNSSQEDRRLLVVAYYGTMRQYTFTNHDDEKLLGVVLTKDSSKRMTHTALFIVGGGAEAQAGVSSTQSVHAREKAVARDRIGALVDTCAVDNARPSAREAIPIAHVGSQDVVAGPCCKVKQYVS